MKLKKIAIIASSAVIAIAFAIVLSGINPAGFLTLADSQKNDSSTDSSRMVESNEVSASLSMQALQQTVLSVKILQANAASCPMLVNLEFEVENSGTAVAERLFVKASENLKVIECVNCSLKEMQPLETAKVRMKACKNNGEKAIVKFYSINAEEKTIEIP